MEPKGKFNRPKKQKYAIFTEIAVLRASYSGWVYKYLK
jgi:hypothetical protein